MMLRTPAAKRPRWSLGSIEGQTPVDPNSAGTMVQYDRSEGLCEEEEEEEEDPRGDLDWDSMRCSYKCRNMVKSELIDQLDCLEKQVVEYEACCEALKSKLSSREIENQRLVSRVKLLDQTVAATTAQEQALRSQRFEEVQQGEERFRKQIVRCNELQEKLQSEIRLKSDAETRARAAEAEISSLKDEINTIQGTAARKIQLLEDEIQRMQDDNKFNISKLDSELMGGRRELENFSEELELLRAQFDDVQEKLNQLTNEKQELERELANTSSQLAMTRITESQEAETIIKSLREELNHQSKEIAEARKKMHFHERLEVLQEQLETEKQRAARAEAELEHHVDLKLRVSSLEAELKAWEDLIAAIPGNLSREDLPQKLYELQRESLVGLSENGDLKSKVKELQSALEKAVAEKQESLAAASLVRQEAEEAQTKVSRLERQVACLTRERDGLNSVLASYDEEETSLLQQQKAGSGATPFATPEKSKQKRIEELEDVLGSLQQTIMSLQRELDGSLEKSKMHQKQAELLASDLALAQSKVSSLERDCSQLQSEIGMLEGKVSRGEFDPSKTKVLRLRTNIQATEIHETSSTNVLENDAHEQVAFMIENKRKIAELTGKISSLQQEITTLKKRENRYMQVFAEKAFTFRTACGLIFGYEILMNEKPDSAVTFFKLKSVYSRDKELETLEFQYTANGQSVGRIDMLANDYTTSPEIQRQVVTFLQGFKSIPAFVANLTLELFNKGTIG